MKKYTASYSSIKDNFVIINLDENQKCDSAYYGIYCVVQNIIQRGKPSIPSGYIREMLGDLDESHKRNLYLVSDSIITANSKEQIDAVNSVSSIVNNKYALAESKLEVASSEIGNEVRQVGAKADENSAKIENTIKNLDTVQESVHSYGEKELADLTELKSMIPVIKRTQVIAIVSALLALVACVLNILM